MIGKILEHLFGLITLHQIDVDLVFLRIGKEGLILHRIEKGPARQQRVLAPCPALPRPAAPGESGRN